MSNNKVAIWAEHTHLAGQVVPDADPDNPTDDWIWLDYTEAQQWKNIEEDVSSSPTTRFMRKAGRNASDALR